MATNEKMLDPRRGQARPHQTQPRQAEMAEDQAVADDAVEHDRSQHDPQGRRRLAQGGGEAAQRLVAQGEGQADGQHRDEDSRVPRQLRRLSKVRQDPAGVEHDQHQRQGGQHGHPQPHAHSGAHAAAVPRPCAEDLGDHRGHRHARAAAEQPGEIEHGVADGRGGQGFPAQAAEQDHVGGHHRHLGQLRHGHRGGQHQQRLGLDEPGRSSQVGLVEGQVGHGRGLSEEKPEPGRRGMEIQKIPPERSGSGGTGRWIVEVI
jgi:hypothetical protein